MGDFCTAIEMKRHAVGVPLINQLENDVLDENFIFPAEKAIEKACNLNLDTDGEPWAWYSIFASYPWKRTKYLNDYKRAVIITVNFWASNPQGLGSQAVGGASASFAVQQVPPRAQMIMEEWGETKRLIRV